MADDTNLTSAVETASAQVAPKTKEKKLRAPRKPRAAAEAVADTSVKKTRSSGKKTAATSAPVAAKPAGKASAPVKRATAAKARPVKQTRQNVGTAPIYTDGFADLLKLEEENQKLRKALSDKLRSENAELRKKLGTA